MKGIRSASDFESWYLDRQVQFSRVLSHSLSLAEATLNDNDVQFLPILSRIKSLESAKEKFLKKVSNDDYEMTDLVGLRVVVFLENDIDRAAIALRSAFDIDEKHCTDKRKSARIDSVGYRSLHLVGSLGSDRSRLPEYRGICDIKFEVQIRTALQHTWAEIEHKRNYKGRFALPPELQRRLMVLSGTLELIDSEFSRIAVEADEYRLLVENSDITVDDDELSFISLSNSIKVAVNRLHPNIVVKLDEDSADRLISELNAFGIKNVRELREFLDDSKFSAIVENNISNDTVHGIGIVRDAMICEDVHKYFERSFQNSFGAMEWSDINYLRSISGEPDMERIIRSYGIDLF